MSNIPDAGLGVFAMKEFPKNTFFGPYTGERHRSMERANRSGYVNDRIKDFQIDEICL
jgi:SET domain-containing protein